jgi:Flp pilus assembly pilin Flp
MSRMLYAFITDETGQDLVEYALLTSLLAVASVATLKLLGGHIKKAFSPISQAL